MSSSNEYELVNINQLALELQYRILAQLPFEDLKRVFLSIDDQDVRDYAEELGEKYFYWENTPLKDLASNGDLEGIQWLAERGANILDPDVIVSAARSGNLELVQWLADQGADISDPSIIEYAAYSGNLKLVQWLDAQRPGA